MYFGFRQIEYHCIIKYETDIRSQLLRVPQIYTCNLRSDVFKAHGLLYYACIVGHMFLYWFLEIIHFVFVG
jgi:hypothetical protein